MKTIKGNIKPILEAVARNPVRMEDQGQMGSNPVTIPKIRIRHPSEEERVKSKALEDQKRKRFAEEGTLYPTITTDLLPRAEIKGK